MSLHILNKNEVALWCHCISALRAGDTVLLIEEASHSLLMAAMPWEKFPSNVELCVLVEDLVLRGISAKIRSEIRRISYSDFVALSLSHDQVISWQ